MPSRWIRVGVLAGGLACVVCAWAGDGDRPGREPGVFTLRAQAAATAHTRAGPRSDGVRVSVPDYAAARGVLLAWVTGQADTVVTDLAAELTRPGYAEIAYVVVSAAQQADATGAFAAAGVDPGKVVFLNAELDSPWIRDYGPHFIRLGGALAVVDSHYHPDRPNDNFVPNQVAEDFFHVPLFYQGLYYSGGDFLVSEDLGTGAGREAYASSRILLDNPPAEGFDAALIGELFQRHAGVDTLNILPQLPATVDPAGHLDAWMSLVDSSSVVISEFAPGSNPVAIQVTDDAAAFMAQKGYAVTRTPAWVVGGDETPPVHYTYANALRVNDRILIPAYGSKVGVGGDPQYDDADAQAWMAWQAAAPEAEIVPIQCASSIAAGGAVHSLTRQIPAHVSPVPSVQLVWPTGGEWLKVGQSYTIRWAADDDVAVTGVDLLYSTDGGATYPHVIARGAANDSRLEWTVPNTPSGQVRIRATAHDGNGGMARSESPADLTITNFAHFDYTFAQAPGSFHYGRGYQTIGWSDIANNWTPVSTPVSVLVPDAYARLAWPDAGSDGSPGDPNRYESPLLDPDGFPVPRCTHVYRFTILADPNKIRSIEVLWEGYTDNCTQTELYVWDKIVGDWGDGAGHFGQNRYMDNQATRRDGTLGWRVSGDFSRYIGPVSKFSLLVYSQRPHDEQYADFVRVRLIYDDTMPPCPGDCNGDTVRNMADLAQLLSCYNSSPCCDINGDGVTDQADLAAFLTVYNVNCPQ